MPEHEGDDEAALIAWQDVLDQLMAGRPDDLVCPYCKARPMTVEEIEFQTRISCGRCGKFIQGRFSP